jgi:DNA-binding beta-propeller fold protein YncE
MYLTRRVGRRILISLLIVILSLTAVGGVFAAPGLEVIPLPDGFAPEGIASGRGSTFYVGSIPTGAIYQGDFLTGEGEILVESQEGRAAIGLKFDPRSGYLFVAGGPTGEAYVYDTATGETVAVLTLSEDPSFINDVVITRDAAYFTNSFQPVIYRVPLERNGQVSSTEDIETIALSGDYQFTPGAFNANGIAATPNGDTLIIVNSTEGALYNVDPETGETTRIDLGGGSVPAGDGILLHGKTLYVVQNQLNQVAVIELNSDLTAGTIVETITSERFRVPTTIARFGSSLYVVNARFGTPVTPETDYDVVQVP